MSAGSVAPPARGRVLRLVLTRYTIGSVVAAVVSEATLLLAYGPGLLRPGAASVAAWAAGAAVNYVLNRRWAWGRRGRASLRRELLPYWTIAVATMALSAWATSHADRLAPRIFEAEGLRTAFVGGAFLAVYGLMFVVKFWLFHYFVFAAGPGARREPTASPVPAARDSRHQVPMTAREYR